MRKHPILLRQYPPQTPDSAKTCIWFCLFLSEPDQVTARRGGWLFRSAFGGQARPKKGRGFHSSPNRLATARFMGGSALIARKVSRESISDGRLSVIVWCIAFNELRTARKP